MSGTLTKYEGLPVPPGTDIWFRVADNGEGSKSNADEISGYWAEDFKLDCNIIYDDGLYEIHGGNIHVNE